MSEKIYEVRKVKAADKGMPLIGDEFPKMEVQTTLGMMKLPKDMKGKWFILFSHPGDFTPVCTTEFMAFQQRIDQFQELNVELIGLSVDQVHSHIKWIDWIKDELGVEITFPIIADTGKVAKTLGIIHPSKGSNTVRAVFIVDPRGIMRAMLYYPQELGRNIDEVIRMVKGFHVNEERGVAIPANWPENDLIGEGVIIPPAADVETARKRLAENKCYDWWFCYIPEEEKE